MSTCETTRLQSGRLLSDDFLSGRNGIAENGGSQIERPSRIITQNIFIPFYRLLYKNICSSSFNREISDEDLGMEEKE